MIEIKKNIDFFFYYFLDLREKFVVLVKENLNIYFNINVFFFRV